MDEVSIEARLSHRVRVVWASSPFSLVDTFTMLGSLYSQGGLNVNGLYFVYKN